LIDHVLIPRQPEPLESIEDGSRALFGAARSVGVLDAKQELAAVVFHEEPVEERRARTADMEIAGWRGGETKAMHERRARATGDGRRATGDGRRATGDGRRAIRR